jgi:hypothetical protein
MRLQVFRESMNQSETNLDLGADASIHLQADQLKELGDFAS